jgi:GT2 family glycosyltransferase
MLVENPREGDEHSSVSRPELSIIVVLYNSASTLPACLQSVRDLVERGWAELIAVDNASPDEAAMVLRRELPGAQLITLEENRGFAAGVNTVLDREHGRYWMLLNPDVLVPPNGLETLVSWMDCHPRLGVASPEIVSADGERQSPGRALPSIALTLLELTRLHRAMPRRTRGSLLRGPYWVGGDQTDVGWVPGTAMIVRPAAVQDVGQLREDLFIYGEDLEWCWRIRRAGWRVGVCSTTTFVHRTSTSAHATFGDHKTEMEIAAGIDAACRSMYGTRRARLLAALTALSLVVESAAPGRTPAHRASTRRVAGVWKTLAMRKQ